MLDVYHSIRYPPFHVDGHGLAGCRGAFTTVQYCCDGRILREPFHLYVLVTFLQFRVAVADVGCFCCIVYRGRHVPAKHLGYVLHRGRVGLHVAHVPHHIRYRLAGFGRRCQVRGRRADYGHPWRFNIATSSGGYYRPAHALGDAGGKLVFRFAIHLLCGCGILRSQCLSPWLDIKMFYGLVFMERRLCRRVWPLFSSIFRLHQVLRQGSGGRCPAPRHRALGVRGETGLAVDGRGT